MEGNKVKKNKHVPKVSIGMPVYNGEKFIRKALDSLLAQTFIDFELIISDNASTDGTPDICAEYANRDKRIRYIRQKQNYGAIWNWNYVLRQATGEYFMWAAHDDTRSPDCLSKYVEVLNNNYDVGLVFSNFSLYNYISGEEKKVYVTPSMLNNKSFNFLIRLFNPVPSLIYGMFRRRFYKRNEKVNDFHGLFFGYYFAVFSKIFIVDDTLYCAGIKEKNPSPYALSGKRMKYAPFFYETLKLLFKQKGGRAAISFIAFVVYFYKLYFNTEKAMNKRR